MRTARGALGASRPAPLVRTVRERLVRVACTYASEGDSQRTCQLGEEPWEVLGDELARGLVRPAHELPAGVEGEDGLLPSEVEHVLRKAVVAPALVHDHRDTPRSWRLPRRAATGRSCTQRLRRNGRSGLRDDLRDGIGCWRRTRLAVHRRLKPGVEAELQVHEERDGRSHREPTVPPPPPPPLPHRHRAERHGDGVVCTSPGGRGGRHGGGGWRTRRRARRKRARAGQAGGC